MSLIMQFFIIFFLSFFFLHLLNNLFKSLSSSTSSKPYKNLPPSPRGLPLIGNLHQLGSRPHRNLHAMAQIHGPLILLRLGNVPVLVASSVDAAREILKTHDFIFSNRPKQNISSRLFYGAKDIAFAPYGEYWRQARSVAVLQLLSNKRVESYRQVREEETALLIKNLQESHESVVNLSDLLISLTNNVICRVALGRTYDGKKFKNLLAKLLELLGSFSIGTYIPSLTWVDRLSGLHQRVDDVAREFDEFIEDVIQKHESKKADVGIKRQDFVDILLEIQRDETMGFNLERDAIKAIILDVFAAGTDTTFTSLEWAITELLRHPHVKKRLQQEVREVGQGKSMITEDDLHEMHYLKAILKETLRLHTPLPLLVPHESTQDVKLLGYDIPRGTQVIINAWSIGRDGSTWEEPDVFKPERFLKDHRDIDYKGFHFELIPFGAGRRGCPGIQFAMVINEIVLANLVYKLDLAVAASTGEDLDMSETLGITVHKKCPILITATTPGCDL